jgi:hypothetical protein
LLWLKVVSKRSNFSSYNTITVISTLIAIVLSRQPILFEVVLRVFLDSLIGIPPIKIGTSLFIIKRLLVADHLEFLQEKGLKVNVQFSNEEEAMEFKNKIENRKEKKDNNQGRNKSPPNEESENENKKENDAQKTQKIAKTKKRKRIR